METTNESLRVLSGESPPVPAPLGTSGSALTRAAGPDGLPPATRSIEVVTAEILEAKRVGGEAILSIGRGLIEAKGMLEHGEWLPWLTEQVEFSERQAQRFMRLATEYSNPTLVSDLGARKALALLALPESEREEFVAAAHEVNGEEKAVADMTSRELEQVIKERDEARKLAENANKEITRLNDEMFNITKSADKLENKLKKTETELKKLKAKPVEVAVEKVVDTEAVKAAETERDRALEAARAADARADIARQNREAAEKELNTLRTKLEAAQRSAADAGDKEVAQFKLYLEAALEYINKANGIRFILERREDGAAAEHARSALARLADKIREAAA